jgi:hypothetical protein
MIQLVYAYEQATQHRRTPATQPIATRVAVRPPLCAQTRPFVSTARAALARDARHHRRGVRRAPAQPIGVSTKLISDLGLKAE